MATATERIRLFETSGIGRQGPWSLLANVRPTVTGYKPIGDYAEMQFDTGVEAMTDAWTHYAGWWRSSRGPLFVLLQTSRDDGYGGTGQLLITDEHGRTEFRLEWDTTDDVMMLPWDRSTRLGSVTAYGHLWLTHHGRVFVLSCSGAPDISSISLAIDGSIGLYEVAWREGIGAGAWPYLSGPMGSPIAASHMGRMFYAGFRDNTGLLFHRTVSEAERQSLLLWGLPVVTGSSLVNIGSRVLVWTDPTDPHAVSLANFREVLSRKSITALASWKNRLLIFTEDETWVLEGNREEDFTLRRIADGIGAQHHECVVVTADGVIFGHATGVFATDGDRVLPILGEAEGLFYGFFDAPDTKRWGTYARWALRQHAQFRPLRMGEWGQFAYDEANGDLWLSVKTLTSGRYSGGFLLYHAKTQAWTFVSQHNFGGVDWLALNGRRVVWVQGANETHVVVSVNGPETGDAVFSATAQPQVLMLTHEMLMNVGRKWRFRGISLAWAGHLHGSAVLLSAEAMAHGAVGDTAMGDSAQGTISDANFMSYAQSGYAGGALWGSTSQVFTARTTQTRMVEATLQTEFARCYLCLAKGNWTIRGVELCYEGGYGNERV